MSSFNRFAFVASCALCVFLSIVVQAKLASGMSDIRPIYYGARVLLHGEDPYPQLSILRAFQAESGDRIPDMPSIWQQETRPVYMPSAMVLGLPLALLPWGAAQAVWMLLTTAALVLAAFLILQSGSKITPDVSLILVCVLIANCESDIALGNPASISVGFCVIAAWCFLEDRLPVAGIWLLAVSLCVKPHNAGWIWLYFVLAGGLLRKRAMQTLAAAFAIMAPSILWVSAVGPQWVRELQLNLNYFGVRDGLNDPGPTGVSFRTACPIIDLQSIFSIFRNDPRFYNAATYLVFGVLFVIFAFATVRSRYTARRAWLALAVVVPLSMLVTYHRPYDAKLLLLAIPACVLLWSGRGVAGRLALGITTAAIVVTADIPLSLYVANVKPHIAATSGWLEKLVMVPFARPVPVVLLVMTVFYLFVYVKEMRDGSRQADFSKETVSSLEPALH
jgi:hypothetical protein